MSSLGVALQGAPGNLILKAHEFSEGELAYWAWLVATRAFACSLALQAKSKRTKALACRSSTKRRTVAMPARRLGFRRHSHS